MWSNAEPKWIWKARDEDEKQEKPRNKAGDNTSWELSPTTRPCREDQERASGTRTDTRGSSFTCGITPCERVCNSECFTSPVPAGGYADASVMPVVSASASNVCMCVHQFFLWADPLKEKTFVAFFHSKLLALFLREYACAWTSFNFQFSG